MDVVADVDVEHCDVVAGRWTLLLYVDVAEGLLYWMGETLLL